jgi:hypothetical protein
MLTLVLLPPIAPVGVEALVGVEASVCKLLRLSKSAYESVVCKLETRDEALLPPGEESTGMPSSLCQSPGCDLGLGLRGLMTGRFWFAGIRRGAADAIDVAAVEIELGDGVEERS